MAWAVLIAQAEGTESSSWPAIILAVLGSSASAHGEIDDACQERADDAIEANTDFARAASSVIKGES